MNQPRQSPGQPIGGQYATIDRAESAVELKPELIVGTCRTHGTGIPAIFDTTGTALCQVCGDRLTNTTTGA